jgi:molybdopterin synthase sulfur carrier subunit
MAQVHLPRSLASLLPGLPRTVEVEGADIRSVLEALETAHPGVLDRLCEPGPRIRPFINVYVDGVRAEIATPVGRTSVVHVIPAVAGG